MWDADGFRALLAVGAGRLRRPRPCRRRAWSARSSPARPASRPPSPRCSPPRTTSRCSTPGPTSTGSSTEGWIGAAGFDRLPDLARYLRALEHRVEKARTQPDRDRRHIAALQEMERDYRRVASRDADGRVRTMLEELRVSTFAQSVGAKGGVSEPKVRAAIAHLA